MSESPPPEIPPARSPRALPEQRSGCLTAFMIVAGLILLLPGLCAVIFGADELTWSSRDPLVTLLVTIGLALGAIGIGLIWSAVRGRRA